jgi:hypothetical protein
MLGLQELSIGSVYTVTNLFKKAVFALVVESQSTPSFRHGLPEPLDRESESRSQGFESPTPSMASGPRQSLPGRRQLLTRIKPQKALFA